MRCEVLLTALATLAPLSNAGAVSSDLLLQRNLDLIDDLTNDEAIFGAFSEAGHPDTEPRQTWTNGDGVVYQSLYSFDDEEWETMRASILTKNGLNETELRGSALVRREEDPPAFFCTNINTHKSAYSASLSGATATICQVFQWGAEAYGRKQIVRRNFPAANGGFVQSAWSVTQKVYGYTSWTVPAGCGIAMNEGINRACSAIEDGTNGEQKATAGFTGANDDIAVGITLT